LAPASPGQIITNSSSASERGGTADIPRRRKKVIEAIGRGVGGGRLDEPPPEDEPADAAPGRARVKRTPFVPARPFCNHEKFLAAEKALEKTAPFVTSVGPYASAYDTFQREQILKKDASIHPGGLKAGMKPGGLWDKYDAGQTGFAALGYNIPESMPPSAHQYGYFYNSSMHKFRNQEGTGAFRM